MLTLLDPYLIWIKLGLLICLCATSGYGGYKWELASFEAYKAKEIKQVLVVKDKQAEVTEKVVIKYIQGAERVRTITKEVIKEVPVRIMDNHELNVGFIVLHNAAATNTIPQAASGTDSTSSGITITEAASTIFENYSTCNETKSKLEALQDWINAQQGLTVQ